jgi:vibriolysin
MRSRRLIRDMAGVALAVSLVGCGPEWVNTDGKDQDNSDIADALARLGDATVLNYTTDGVPTYIVGDMAHVGDGQIDDLDQAEAAIRPALAPVLAAFRMTTDEVKLRKVNVDDSGIRHYRFDMVADGMDVIGGDMVVKVDIKGAIAGINGNGRGDLPRDGSDDISSSSAMSKVSQDARFSELATATPRKVYLITEDSKRYRAYEVMALGYRGEDPARDAVYVDAQTGDIVAVHPKIHFARNRRVYSANNGSSLPGTLRRSEGQAATSDVDVNAAYDGSGSTWQLYNHFWNRDSFDNAGALLSSTVHYSTNYCNAFWDGTQMVYGDGNASQNCAPLARSVDVTAHELTHAVTEHESNLTYSGESGGINEAMSDIFGAGTEAFVDGGSNGTLAVSAAVWLIGDEILPPFLRRMDDPRADGVSKDFWYNGVGNVDVHYSSGIANLAFYLLSQGGTHPQGETTTNVTGIGMEKALRVFYKANTDKLTSGSNYAALRLAAEQSASELGFTTAEQTSVSCAFAAVKVGTAPASCGGTEPPPPTDTPLLDETPITGISGTTGNEKFYVMTVPAGQTSLVINIAGGTGDADLYVRQGSRPTTSAYNCRPYLNGNNETCTITNPAAGSWFVMLRAYSNYSGVTLTGNYSGTTTPPGDPYLTLGTAVTGQSGASGSFKFWRVAVQPGTYTVRISGGTGDADLYTRFGSRPTTSTYACRPYTSGNNESCTFNATTTGDLYVGVRGYSSYSGVSVVATSP